MFSQDIISGQFWLQMQTEYLNPGYQKSSFYFVFKCTTISGCKKWYVILK